MFVIAYFRGNQNKTGWCQEEWRKIQRYATEAPYTSTLTYYINRFVAVCYSVLCTVLVDVPFAGLVSATGAWGGDLLQEGRCEACTGNLMVTGATSSVHFPLLQYKYKFQWFF